MSKLHDRWRKNGHQSGVIWFTGLSGSGKTTLAMALERRLFLKGYKVFVLDGDNVRHGMCRDLGFLPEDREENIRRVIYMASMFATCGMVVLTSFISPYRSDRETARNSIGRGFNEIFLDSSLETCEARDPKGLYKKARAGEIKNFTGISAPYEAPRLPEVQLDTAVLSINECTDQLLEFSLKTFLLPN